MAAFAYQVRWLICAFHRSLRQFTQNPEKMDPSKDSGGVCLEARLLEGRGKEVNSDVISFLQQMQSISELNCFNPS